MTPFAKKLFLGIAIIVVLVILVATPRVRHMIWPVHQTVLAANTDYCYESSVTGDNGMTDRDELRLSVDGSGAITGTFGLFPAEKDQKQGPVTGSLSQLVSIDGAPTTYELRWTASAEGMTNNEQLYVQITADGARAGFGEMTQEGTTDKWNYADASAITYGGVMKSVACVTDAPVVTEPVVDTTATTDTPATPDTATVPNTITPVPLGVPATSLAGTRWKLATITSPTVAIAQLEKFTLSFEPDRVAIGTDCNNAGGDYTITGNKLTFGPMISTMMYCDGSDESTYLQILERAQSYTKTATDLTITTSQGHVLNYKKI